MPTVGLLFDSWHLWREPLEQVERHRGRIRGVHLADWREPTRNTNDRVLPGDGAVEFGPILDVLQLGRLLRPGDLLGRRARGIALARGAARACPARPRGPTEDGIDRICVVGAGVIGSLFAGHLGRVAEVSVLCRREEHAAALNEHGLRVSGRSDFVTPVRAATDPAELPEPELVIVATKTTELEAAAAPHRRPLARSRGDDRAERPRRRGGVPGPPRPLGGHVHERHAPRGHARRVHPRHRDLARAVRRDAVRAGGGGRRPRSSPPA